MSNVIPFLSASPPPIDDPPSLNDDWENDDFGGFQAAGPTGGTKPGLPGPQPSNTEQRCLQTTEKPNNGIMNDSPEEEWADFSGPEVVPPPVVDGEFVAFPTDDSKTGSSSAVSAKDVSLDHNLPAADLPAHMGLQLRSTIDRTVAHGDGRKSPRSSSSSTGSQDDRQNSCGEDFTARPHEPKFPKPDTQDNTSQDSVTDSGLCSDISPVPKFEEYPDFGDNKSSEVEFSDECQSKVGTILEQDEGFANFGLRDSCGTGSDNNQSPDRDSAGPDPLDLRPVSGAVEGKTDTDKAEQEPYSCASGEGAYVSSEFDPDAVTPTQSHYDNENLRSDSSTPNPKISPDQETTSEHINAELSSETLHHGQHGGTSTDTSDTCDPLEGSMAKSSEPALQEGIADSQSTGSVPNFASFQESEVEPGTMATSCDSSGTQQTSSSHPSSEQHSELAAPSQTPSKTSAEATTENSDHSDDDDDDWDFQDASGSQNSAEITTPTPEVQKLPDQGKQPTAPAESKTDDDDDFGDLAFRQPQEAGLVTEGNDEEEEDDWAFQGSETTFAPTDNIEADDNDDGFGNFASTSAQSGFADFGSSKQSEGPDDDNNWASFSEPALAAPPLDAGDSDDGEFGDFGEAPTATSLSEKDTLTQPSGDIQLPKKESIDEVLTQSFKPPALVDEPPKVELLFVHMTHQILRQEPAPVKQPGRHSNVKSAVTDMSVWNNLRDLEKTAALRYAWDKSSNNNCLLHSLSIDTRNILIGHKKPSVPIFASNLGSGVLEPCRGLPEVGRDGRVSDVNTIHVNTNKLTAGTPQDIPPAEFDWSSAGLTNPLDSSNIQLDLDFFVKKTAWSGYSAYTATSPTAALENELLKSIEPPESKQPRTLVPLENYLANLNVASTAPPNMNQENDADHLSEAAYDIVTKFPAISFMHAKMLMFPVKGSAD